MNFLNGTLEKKRKNNLPPKKVIAVIDAGTNTFRLLVSEATMDGIYNPFLIDRRIVRLGENYYSTGMINSNAAKRAISILKGFKRIIDKHSAQDVYVAGTSIFRDAGNSKKFIKDAEIKTGLSINVLTPDTEAKYSLLGAVSALPSGRNILLIDIGGGSTEFTLWSGDKLNFCFSCGLGVVHLYEEFIKHDSPTEEEINSLERFIEKTIRKFYNEFKGEIGKVKGLMIFGTAGTVTTLASVLIGLKKFNRSAVNGYKIEKFKLAGLYRKFTEMTHDERLALRGMDKGREDLIIPGAAIILIALRILKKKIITVTDYSLLEGLAINLINNWRGI